MIGDGIFDRMLVIFLFAPLSVPAASLILGLLCGLIPAARLWRDSFAAADLSPVRIHQLDNMTDLKVIAGDGRRPVHAASDGRTTRRQRRQASHRGPARRRCGHLRGDRG